MQDSGEKLIVPTSIITGLGTTEFYTNIREFKDVRAAHASVVPILQASPVWDYTSSQGGLEEYAWLKSIMDPHIPEAKAALFTNVHLAGRGKPASDTWEVRWVKKNGDPNYWLVVRDAEVWLTKKVLKGLASRVAGGGFFDPPSVKYVTVDPTHDMHHDLKELLTYIPDSGRKHRALMAKHLSQAMKFDISHTWRAHVQGSSK